MSKSEKYEYDEYDFVDDAEFYLLQTKIKGDIKQVIVGNDDQLDEVNAYQIIIETDKGKWKICGCHDDGPYIMKRRD